MLVGAGWMLVGAALALVSGCGESSGAALQAPRQPIVVVRPAPPRSHAVPPDVRVQPRRPDQVFSRALGGPHPWSPQCLRGRHTVVRLGGSGPLAERFEVRDGDHDPATGSERCELAGFDFRPPAEYWIRYAIYVPSRTRLQDLSWLSLFQYKESSDTGPPPMEMFLDYAGGAGRFRLASGDSSTRVWSGPTIARGQWYDFTTHVRFDASPREGFVELWLDGRRQPLANGRRREYLATARRGAQNYLKAGIYRDPRHTVTTVVYESNITVGDSYRAVNPAG